MATTYGNEWCVVLTSVDNTTVYSGLSTSNGSVKQFFTTWEDANDWAKRIYGDQEYKILRYQDDGTP